MPFLPSYFGACDELPSERTGTPFDVTTMSRNYTRRFLVELRGGLESGKGLGPIAACSHPYLPVAFAPYSSYNGLEYDTLALLIKYDAVQRDKDDTTFWIVTAYYSTTMPPGGQFQEPSTGGTAGFPTGGTNPSNNPELEFPDINWSFEDIQRAATVDRNKKPYINSVGQPFTPAFVRPRAVRTLNITRNELDFNSVKAEEYAYALNDAEFLGAPSGFVQCMPPHAQQQFRGKYRYWRVSYKFRFFPRGFIVKRVFGTPPDVILTDEELNWQPMIQDQGFCRKGDDGKPKQILGSNGHPITHQVLLNGFGQPQTDKDANDQLIPIYMYFIEFVYKDMSSVISRGFS